MFSANTRSVERKHVLEEFNISVEAMTEKYLRLPVHVGMYIINTFVYLRDHIWKKIHGWKERLLSKVGKDILIKTCAQTTPTFAISCFDITKTTMRSD
jgi:hypothetical protein